LTLQFDHVKIHYQNIRSKSDWQDVTVQ